MKKNISFFRFRGFFFLDYFGGYFQHKSNLKIKLVVSQRRRRKLGRKCGTSCTGGAPLLIIIKLAGNSKIDLQSTTSFSRMCQQSCSSTKWTYSKTRLCAKKWTFPNTLKRSLVTLIKYVNTFKNSMVIRSICKMSKTSFSTSL